MFKRFLDYLARQRARRFPRKLVIGESGFQLLQGEKSVCEIEWSEIGRIVAYKRDLGNSDLVCFDIERGSSPSPSFILVHEELDGFEALELEFARKLESYRADWREVVILPAFARNETTIYTAKPAGTPA